MLLLTVYVVGLEWLGSGNCAGETFLLSGLAGVDLKHSVLDLCFREMLIRKSQDDQESFVYAGLGHFAWLHALILSLELLVCKNYSFLELLWSEIVVFTLHHEKGFICNFNRLVLLVWIDVYQIC